MSVWINGYRRGAFYRMSASVTHIVLRNFHGNLCRYTVTVFTDTSTTTDVRYTPVSNRTVEESTIQMHADVMDVTGVWVYTTSPADDVLLAHADQHGNAVFKRPCFVVDLPVLLQTEYHSPTVRPSCTMYFTNGAHVDAPMARPTTPDVESTMRVAWSRRYTDNAIMCGICGVVFGPDDGYQFGVHLLPTRVQQCIVVCRDEVQKLVDEMS